jgi:signal transduction histidine kinase
MSRHIALSFIALLLTTQLVGQTSFDSELAIIDSTLNQTNFELAMARIDSVAAENPELSRQAKLHIRRGHAFGGIGQPKARLEEYLKALDIWRKVGNEHEQGNTYLSIGNTYWDKDRFDEALVFYRKTLETGIKYNDREQQAGALENIAACYTDKDSLLSAINLFRGSAEYYLGEKDYVSVERCYNSIGHRFQKLGMLDSAMATYHRALRFDVKPSVATGYILNNLGLVYETKNELDSAQKYYSACLALCDTINSIKLERLVVRNLAELYALQGDSATAYNFLQRHRKLTYQKSLIDKDREVIELQEEFHAAERELEIERQKALRNALIGTLVFLIIISGLILFFVRRNQRIKLQLANQTIALKDAEISGMFSDLTLQRATAQAEGELAERRRFGRELHDRIGPMLSSIKLKFSAVSEVMDAKDAEDMENGLHLLDSSVEEIRRISHNLSSGVLAKLGFVTMIDQLVERINNTGELAVRFTHHGLSEGVPLSVENELVAIIQEIVHNALKHAKARTLSIDITKDDNEVSLVLEDDGRGFNPETVADGIGLKNLRYRISELQGHMSVDSKIGRGTVVLIDVPLTNSTAA